MVLVVAVEIRATLELQESRGLSDSLVNLEEREIKEPWERQARVVHKGSVDLLDREAVKAPPAKRDQGDHLVSLVAKACRVPRDRPAEKD